ncbi:cupin domain-containing protein [Mesobacillus maritimus]|uniref:cupin domain-containing protein n=1 Tax=Mesobacillus maritimus TaxID=1643336 RepID=UPI00203C8C1F|nr:cupin domain-containing protein [Mesobacillus maritimus]MCM3586863.1 cupin domain-containing protein [Mesobacillus maritimus]
MEKQTLNQYQEFNEERFTKRIVFKKGDNTVFLLNFLPGQELPPHAHPGSDVFIQMMQGEGTFTVDGKEASLKQNEVLHCQDQEKLAFKNTGTEPVTLYVVLTKIPDERFAQDI